MLRYYNHIEHCPYRYCTLDSNVYRWHNSCYTIRYYGKSLL